MDYKYFKLKFILTNAFYYEVITNKHSYEEASRRCYESFEHLINDSLDKMIFLSQIITFKIRHNVMLDENDYRMIAKVICIYNSLDEKTLSNMVEYEYLEDDISLLKKITLK